MKYEPYNIEGRYFKLTVLENGNLRVQFTEEGVEAYHELVSEKTSEFYRTLGRRVPDNERTPLEDAYMEKFLYELFEDISSNSEWDYANDLGESGFGLTNSPGFIFGNRDEDGEWEDDVEVFHFNWYMLRSFLEDMVEKPDEGAEFWRA
jgi:hypothetical protein